MKSLVKKIMNRLPLFAALLGAGLALVTTMSAFKGHTEKMNGSHDILYWFSIYGSHAYNSSIPSADANYLDAGTVPPTGSTSSCNTSGTNLCVGGFSESQVENDGNGGKRLKNNSQSAQVNIYRRD